MSKTATRPRSDANAPLPTPAPPPSKGGVRERLFKRLGKGPADPAAEQRLKDQKAKLKEEKKAASDRRDAVKKEAKADKAEVVYRDRLARMKSAREDIQRWQPASAELIKAIDGALAAARIVLFNDSTAFKVAYDALHPKGFSLGSVAEQAQKLHENAWKKARSGHPDVFLVSDEIREHLKTAPLTARRIDQIAAERQSVIHPLGKPDVKDTEASAAKAQLSALLQTLLVDRSAAEDKRDKVRRKTVQAQQAFTDAGLLVTSQAAAPMQAKLNGAASAVAEHDYDAADAMLDLVLQEAGGALAAQGPYRERWLKERGSLATLKGRVKEQYARLGSGEAVQATDTAATLRRVATDLEMLTREMGDGATDRALGAISYKDAVDLVTVAATDLDAVARQIDLLNKFAGAKAIKRGELAKAFAGTRQKIAALETAVGEVDDTVDATAVSAPFRDRLAAVQAAWDTRCTSAFDAATLDAASTSKAIEVLNAAIDAASQGSGTADTIAKAKADQAAKACAIAVAAAKAAVDRLAGCDVDEATPFYARAAALDKRVAERDTEQHYTQCAATAATLRDDAGREVAGLESMAKAAQKLLSDEAAAIAAQLEAFWKGVQAISDTARRDAYATLHTSFTAALDALRAVAKLQQLSMLEEALADARTLAVNVADTVGEFDKSVKDKLLSTVSGGKLGRGVNTATLEDVRKKLANQRARLADKELRSFAGDTAFALSQRLDDIEKAIGSAAMAELVKRIAAIADEITDAEKTAADERATYDAFKLKLEGTAKLLDDKLLEHVPALKKAYQAQLTEIRAEARQQGGVPKALPLLTNLTRLITLGLVSKPTASGIPTDFVEGQKMLVEAEEKRTREKARWAGNVTVLEKKIDAMPTGMAGEQGSLRDRLATADKAYKQSGDYDAAWAQYSAINARLVLVSKNPDGLKMHARGQLPAVRGRWVGAVGRLKDGLAKLETAINGVADEPDFTPDLKRVVATELNAIRGLFNVASFDKPVEVVTRPGVDDKARAAAREQALREVRRMRDLIRNDQRLRILAQRKMIGHDLAGELSETSLALADMETNMLVSL